MSNISIQKHLPCHDYHMGDCPLPKEKCPFSHVGKSWGICPNKNYCPTPHKLVDCPLFLSNSCPRGDNCSYRHKKEEVKENKDETNQQEEQKSSDNKQQDQDEQSQAQNTKSLSNNDLSITKKQIIKGLTIEDFKSSLIEINQDLKILMPIIEKEKVQAHRLHSSASLDLCFIVDITGSMSCWMNQVVSYVGSTLNTIYEDFPAIDLRVAFAGYRDYCDSNRFVTYDFTRNVEEFRGKIAAVSCSGGGDAPENVVGGLYNALQFDWGSAARQVVFIADSPTHGNKYHDGLGDDHPNGDPDGKVLEDLMEEFKQKRIDFTVIEINGTTKKMFQIMSQSYGQGLVQKDLKSGGAVKGSNNLSGVMHEQIKSTVTASLSKSGIGTGNAPKQQNGKLGQAFSMIMENKRFRKNFSWSKSKEKSSKQGVAMIQQQIEETKVLEEEEYDTDDSDYESKLEETCKRQYKQAVQDKETRIKKEKESKLALLKSQFPSHYFDTVQEHTVRNQKKIKEKTQKVLYLEGAINWDNFISYNEYQAICYSFELVKNYKSGQEINWKNLEINTFYLGTKVKISNLVFSEGAMRYAYHAKDLYLKQRMVAKQYKKSEKQQKMTIEDMKRDIISQIVCQYIVKEFNSKIVEQLEEQAMILQFIDCYIYETTFPYNSNKHYYFEKFIEGKYEKFNNNAGYVSQTDNEYSELAQTLSHFSWQLSKGYLAIVDLQGNDRGILTDPQVHCLDQDKFGDGNLGYEGILRFFSTHECNDYCKMLQLIHPYEQSYIPLNNSFFFDYNCSSQANVIKDPSALMSQLCDICQHPKSFSIQQSLDSKKNNTRLVCLTCKDKISNSIFEKKCAQCPTIIQFSTYECIQLRRDAPPLCPTCVTKQ